MSKKRFVLLALVVAFLLALASGAFAAAPPTRTWKGADGASWGEAANWVEGVVPAATDVVTFPNTTKTVNIVGTENAGAIVVDTGTTEAVFSIANGAVLQIAGNVADALGNDVPAITAKGHALFKGAGTVDFQNIGAVSGAFQIDVFAEKTLKFETIVSSQVAVVEILKTSPGTLAFAANQANAFNAAMLAMTIQDGEVSITRADHLNNAANLVYFDTEGVQGRTATLTTAWTNSQSFAAAGKITATTNGIINVPNEGSTFVLRTAAGTMTANDRTITKIGAGTLQVGRAGDPVVSVWTSGANPSSLNIREGNVVVDNTNAFDPGVVNVTIGAGTSYTLNKTFEQYMAELAGSGTLRLLEGSNFVIMADSEFPGYITGAGSVQIGEANAGQPIQGVAVATITGATNDYSGDTYVTTGSKVVINHEKNLGGTKLGKLYLQPLDLVATNAPAVYNLFARLEIADGYSGILPNEIYVGSSIRDDAQRMRQTGSSVIIIPKDVRFEVANNITFNQNALVKIGEGDLVLSSLGYDNIGNGTFTLGDAVANTVSTSMHILNGLVRIENEKAVALGDIIVDAGGFPAGRPVFSIRNGLKMSNSIYFTNQSSFATELIDANLSQGTSVASAVEVGKVFFDRTFVEGNTVWNGTGIVYNRVAFDQLTTGTISKGNDFQLMKAVQFTNYDAPKVEPTYWDGQVKAPFDPYFSNVYLYFKATHNIDVPVLGAASPTASKVGEAYKITVPVTSTTGILAGSPTVNNLPGVTSVTTEGSNVVINGVAPAISADYKYRVTVTTAGNVATDTLGYEGYREYTMSFGDGSGPQPITPTLSGAMTADKTTPVKGSTVLFTVGDWTFKDTTGATTTYAWNDSSITYGIPGGSIVELTGPATIVSYDLAVSPVIEVKVNDDAAAGSAITVKVNAEHAGVAGVATATVTTPVAPTPHTSSSSGCDAGFGAFALLAMAGGALVLRKKD